MKKSFAVASLLLLVLIGGAQTNGTFGAKSVVGTNITDSALTSGNCVQASTAGLLTTTSGPCSTFNPATPGAIGGTTPAAGTFTTLAATGHIQSNGSGAPTISSCGGGTLVTGGTDNAFRITGISTATSCTATFSSNIRGVCVAGATGSGGTGIVIGTVPNSANVVFNITTLTTDINAICY